jgi:hypothetical protein
MESRPSYSLATQVEWNILRGLGRGREPSLEDMVSQIEADLSWTSGFGDVVVEICWRESGRQLGG